jgi:hypothetical protein
MNHEHNVVAQRGKPEDQTAKDAENAKGML